MVSSQATASTHTARNGLAPISCRTTTGPSSCEEPLELEPLGPPSRGLARPGYRAKIAAPREFHQRPLADMPRLGLDTHPRHLEKQMRTVCLTHMAFEPYELATYIPDHGILIPGVVLF